MGVSISGNGEKMTFSCDNQQCLKKTVRAIRPHWYDRVSGRTYRGTRRIRKPFAYWSKVLRKPKRRNTVVFFSFGA